MNLPKQQSGFTAPRQRGSGDTTLPLEMRSHTSTVPSAVSNATTSCRILVTVGTDLPFDRLVCAIDEWAYAQKRHDVFAQIGDTDWKPRHIAYRRFLEPDDFRRKLQEADLIISHAGMGTILSSLRYGKPLLVVPRIAARGEHRNEHQLATAKHLSDLGKLSVAADEHQLIAMLEDFENVPAKELIGPYASKQLTDSIRAFIDS